MPKPSILQIGPYPEWDQAPLEAAFEMLKPYEAEDAQAYLAEHGPKARGIATRGNLTVGRDVMDACPNLEVIVVYGVGYDGVDIAACKARGIRVTNTPDVLTGDVADFGGAMMLALSRGIVGGEAWVRSGAWATKGGFQLGRRVFGQKAGILGLGRIGDAVARRLVGFNMQIAYSDVGPKHYASGWTFIADPVALADWADVLFVTLSATADTAGLVGQKVLEALGPDGMLVNISRASNVDE